MGRVGGVQALSYQLSSVFRPVVGDCRSVGAGPALVCWVVGCAGALRVFAEHSCTEAVFVGASVSAVPGGASPLVGLACVFSAPVSPCWYWCGAAWGGAGVHGTGHGGLLLIGGWFGVACTDGLPEYAVP